MKLDTGSAILRTAILVMASSGVSAAGQAEVGADVFVHVLNYSRVSKETLDKAMNVAQQVYDRAGVSSMWVEYPVADDPAWVARLPKPQPGQAQFFLRVTPDSKIAPWANSQKLLGFSIIPEKADSAFLGGAYADRAESVAKRHSMPLSLVLGTVLAHELGHLLLGANSHSRFGMMAFPLTPNMLLLAEQGQLGFDRKQIEKIRSGLARRTLALRAAGR